MKTNQTNEYFTYSEYKVIISKVCTKIYAIISKCLSSGEYMQIKNTLILLKRISLFYPQSKDAADKVDKLLETL